jgi:broad specificity phosphatase PhoE
LRAPRRYRRAVGTRPARRTPLRRRRIYLLRHAEVAYFDEDGQPLPPDDVPLTARGRRQAETAGAALAAARFDRVVASGLPRTVATARLVAGPGATVEDWPELREIAPGRLADIPEEELEAAFLGVFRGVVAGERRFLGGETVDALLDRVLEALDRLLADPGWDTLLAVLHGGVNRAILSFALTGRRQFLGAFEQAPACINVLDVDEAGGFVVRAVNVTPWDPAYLAGRTTTMEELWSQYRPGARRRQP